MGDMAPISPLATLLDSQYLHQLSFLLYLVQVVIFHVVACSSLSHVSD